MIRDIIIQNIFGDRPANEESEIVPEIEIHELNMDKERERTGKQIGKEIEKEKIVKEICLEMIGR